MNGERTLNSKLEMVTWGALFIWWGMTDSDFGLFRPLPQGIGWIGIGLILLGLNVARSMNGIRTNGFSITLGILACTLGGLELASTLLHLPSSLPIFAILMVVLGITFLTRELYRSQNKQPTAPTLS